MYLMIEIPEEFEKDFNNDKFKECFERLLADTKDRFKEHNILLAGNYEIETLKMFIESFENADIVDKELVSFVKRGK